MALILVKSLREEQSTLSSSIPTVPADIGKEFVVEARDGHSYVSETGKPMLLYCYLLKVDYIVEVGERLPPVLYL